MQFAILKSKYYNYHEYTIIYKKEDIYYYSFPIYWSSDIQNVIDNSTIKMVTDFNIPDWIKTMAISDIIWLNIDKPENIPIEYPELFI